MWILGTTYDFLSTAWSYTLAQTYELSTTGLWALSMTYPIWRDKLWYYLEDNFYKLVQLQVTQGFCSYSNTADIWFQRQIYQISETFTFVCPAPPWGSLPPQLNSSNVLGVLFILTCPAMVPRKLAMPFPMKEGWACHLQQLPRPNDWIEWGSLVCPLSSNPALYLPWTCPCENKCLMGHWDQQWLMDGHRWLEIGMRSWWICLCCFFGDRNLRNSGCSNALTFLQQQDEDQATEHVWEEGSDQYPGEEDWSQNTFHDSAFGSLFLKRLLS